MLDDISGILVIMVGALLLVILDNISVVDEVSLEGLLPLGEVVPLVSQVV